MTLAAETREAVRRNPFVYEAVRAGICNYSAVARFLPVGEGDEEAVVAALRRYAADLSDFDVTDREARVTMQSGLGEGDAADALVVVGDVALVPDAGRLTGIVATGDVDARALGHVLGRLDTDSVDVRAAAVADRSLVVVVGRRDGPDALRTIEDALASVPTDEPGA